MSDTIVTGVKHTRYTMLVRLHPECVLRADPLPDPPSKNRDYCKDSIAVTVVCYRQGSKPGEIDFLAILYENGGGRGITYRFPTETGEQDLNEPPDKVAEACLNQEVLTSNKGHLPEIGPVVLENVRPSDSKRNPGPKTLETLSPPEWYEAADLMDRMISRGIRSHRDSLVAAINHLAGTDKAIALKYARKLNDWGAYI